MKSPLRLLIALSALAALAGPVVAQPASAPMRADVAADARAAVQSGSTAEGELVDSRASPRRATSDRSRSEVKREAKAAVKSGDTLRGEAIYRGPDKAEAGASGRSRAQVKQEARATVGRSDATLREAASYGGPEKAGSAAGRR